MSATKSWWDVVVEVFSVLAALVAIYECWKSPSQGKKREDVREGGIAASQIEADKLSNPASSIELPPGPQLSDRGEPEWSYSGTNWSMICHLFLVLVWFVIVLSGFVKWNPEWPGDAIQVLQTTEKVWCGISNIVSSEKVPEDRELRSVPLQLVEGRDADSFSASNGSYYRMVETYDPNCTVIRARFCAWLFVNASSNSSGHISNEEIVTYESWGYVQTPSYPCYERAEAWNDAVFGVMLFIIGWIAIGLAFFGLLVIPLRIFTVIVSCLNSRGAFEVPPAQGGEMT